MMKPEKMCLFTLRLSEPHLQRERHSSTPSPQAVSLSLAVTKHHHMTGVKRGEEPAAITQDFRSLTSQSVSSQNTKGKELNGSTDDVTKCQRPHKRVLLCSSNQCDHMTVLRLGEVYFPCVSHPGIHTNAYLTILTIPKRKMMSVKQEMFVTQKNNFHLSPQYWSISRFDILVLVHYGHSIVSNRI